MGVVTGSQCAIHTLLVITVCLLLIFLISFYYFVQMKRFLFLEDFRRTTQQLLMIY